MPFDAWRRDLWYSLRFLRRNAGFSATVALTFGLGVGATAAIFTVVSGVLLRPLPFPEPHRLVSIQISADNKAPNVFVSSSDAVEWQKQSRTMTVAGYFDASVNLDSEQGAERLECGSMTASLLPMLGVQPVLGRNFLPEEDRPGGPPAVILSHRFWQHRYAGDRAVVGRSIRLDGKDHRIAGVFPENFRIPVEFRTEQDLWLPLQLAEGRANFKMLWAVGRLRPGVSLETARAELDTMLQVARAGRRGTYRIVLTPWQERITGRVRSTLLIFLASVALVLTIACVNVANLLLSKSAGRRKEMAVRRALGAGAADIVRRLLTESALLALAGALAGLLMAYAARGLLVAFLAGILPTVPAIPFDARVLAFTLGVAALCGLAFGLAPALLSARVPVAECLKDTGLGSGGGRERLRDLLVVGEVALATALMIGAGLLFTSFLRLRGQDPGMPADQILTVSVEMKGAKYATLPAQAMFFRDALREARGIPGVESATIVTSGTVSGSWPEGRPYRAEWNAIDPAFFGMMGLRLTRGRNFADSDGPHAPSVAIVSQSFSRTFCPQGDCFGVRFPLPGRGEAEIVGIVADRPMWSDREPEPAIYTHYIQQDADFARTLMLRASGDPKRFIPLVRQRLAAVDRSQAPSHFQTLEDEMAESVAPRRVHMLLLGAFAVLATLLGAAGIYGVMAHAVARRTHEIGVRVALGAERADIRTLILGRGLLLVAIGEAIGIAGALALNRVIAGLLFHTRPTDPATYTAVAVVWIAVGLVACYVPASRAMRVEPTVALRYE
jgi:putative ABC transport system permease protein